MKIVVIGASGVGKTDIVSRIIDSEISKTCMIPNPKLKEISSKQLNPEYNKLVNDNLWSLV